MSKAKIYEHAVKRYFKEMDVLNIVRTGRMTRLLMKYQMSKRQRILLSYQRQQVIESNTSDFDCSDMNDLKKEISSKSKLVGVTALGRKVMPSIMRYADKEKPLSYGGVRVGGFIF